MDQRQCVQFIKIYRNFTNLWNSKQKITTTGIRKTMRGKYNFDKNEKYNLLVNSHTVYNR